MIKIKYKVFNNNAPLKIMDKGDWIDLRASKDVTIKAPKILTKSEQIVIHPELIPLGIGIALPKGYEAIVAPRSSSYKNFGIISANSIGIIDYSYRGNTDEWFFPALGLANKTIKRGDRICQFRIQLSQKATFWQKLKWLFTSKIEFVLVDNLDSSDRGGLGSTGIK